VGVSATDHFSAIVESSEDAILSKDQDATITSWNPAAERLYGYTAEEAIGRPISILIPSHRAGEEQEILGRILEGERVEHYETERVRKDGSEVVVSLTISPIQQDDGSITGASVIARDVTERRRALERATRLQSVTSGLAKAVTPEEAVEVVVREGVSALGADAGAVGLLDDSQETLRVAGYSGYSEAALAKWESFPVNADVPMAEVVRTGEPLWHTGREELAERYTELAGSKIVYTSRAVLPLSVQGRVLGAVSLSFREAREFDPEVRAYLLATVQQAAYALDRARLHAAERQARLKLDFLAQASSLLAQSLDVETTLQQVALLAISQMADWCTIDLLDDDGAIKTVAVAHADPAKLARAREFQRRYPPDPDAPTGSSAVIRTGNPEIHPDITHELLVASAPDDEALEMLHELGLRSAMVVPLVARDRTLGAINLVAAESDRTYTAEDLDVACDLGRRAGIAVENSMLYRKEHRVALTLQRSLLPSRLPSLPGVELAGRYLPAGSGIQVGGDWYDAIELGDGRLTLVVGDVAGRGTRAASVMGQMRNSVRAYVLDGHPPTEVAARLNRLTKTFDRTEMATLMALSYELRTRSAECVRAGHTPPLLRMPDGEVIQLDIPGSLPIGAGQAPYRSTTFQIQPGSLLLIYTDGLVERRDEGVEPGIEALKLALAHAPDGAEECADYILEKVFDEESEDDVALVAMHVQDLANAPFRLDTSADASSLARIRRSLEAWLDEMGVERSYQVVGACHEAAANSVEHAYPPADPGTVEISGSVEGDGVAIEVVDHGRWREPRGEGRGRGFTLMKHFMDEVDVDRSDRGTTVRMSRRIKRGEE
jgi:PAS domain S-box-containing protein